MPSLSTGMLLLTSTGVHAMSYCTYRQKIEESGVCANKSYNYYSNEGSDCYRYKDCYEFWNEVPSTDDYNVVNETVTLCAKRKRTDVTRSSPYYCNPEMISMVTSSSSMDRARCSELCTNEPCDAYQVWNKCTNKSLTYCILYRQNPFPSKFPWLPSCERATCYRASTSTSTRIAASSGSIALYAGISATLLAAVICCIAVRKYKAKKQSDPRRQEGDRMQRRHVRRAVLE